MVKKSGGDRYCKHFTAWKQFLTLLFAQISGKDSLRKIEHALLANHKRLYQLGMEAVAKSTLSEGKTYQFITNNFRIAASSIKNGAILWNSI
ncbi:MAG: DUF4372 domain-containing protein [Lentisphaerae bacterium]|nr:DUF4372 domain-containing protein [Lentisphaerota bacterium]